MFNASLNTGFIRIPVYLIFCFSSDRSFKLLFSYCSKITFLLTNSISSPFCETTIFVMIPPAIPYVEHHERCNDPIPSPGSPVFCMQNDLCHGGSLPSFLIRSCGSLLIIFKDHISLCELIWLQLPFR